MISLDALALSSASAPAAEHYGISCAVDTPAAVDGGFANYEQQPAPSHECGRRLGGADCRGQLPLTDVLLDQWRMEVRALASLNHPNIVRPGYVACLPTMPRPRVL